MSRNRSYLTRPRTKVYDCNYNIGQNYYKSALDNLDRKYGGSGVTESTIANGAMAGLRASLERERNDLSVSKRMSAAREMAEDDYFNESSRKTNTSALLNEFDSMLDSRSKSSVRSESSQRRAVKVSEDIDEDLADSIKRLRANRAARAKADEFEEIESSMRRPIRSKLDITDKIMDSVGLNERARAHADDSLTVSKRKVLQITSSSANSGEDQSLTKWTALGTESRRKHALEEADDSSDEIAAQARARKSKARLADLEAEMQELTEKSVARAKRVQDLRALLRENELECSESQQSTVKSVKVKSTVQSEKKMVSF